MVLHAYLFVNSQGKIRITRKETGTYPDELALHLKIDVPDSFWRRPIPSVNIQVPDFQLEPSPEVTAAIVAPEIADKLKLDVKKVEDGLVNMFKEKQEQEQNNNG